jgi:hypothetical protein
MAKETADLPELSDDVLKSMGMTRENWERHRAERRVREAGSPNVGDVAPDFELPLLGDRSTKVRLSGFKGRRPVGLIFGSYT